MRKVWIGLGVAAGVIAVGLGTAWLMRERLAQAAMRKVYEQVLAVDTMQDLPDGLHVGLCGAG